MQFLLQKFQLLQWKLFYQFAVNHNLCIVLMFDIVIEVES